MGCVLSTSRTDLALTVASLLIYGLPIPKIKDEPFTPLKLVLRQILLLLNQNLTTTTKKGILRMVLFWSLLRK